MQARLGQLPARAAIALAVALTASAIGVAYAASAYRFGPWLPLGACVAAGALVAALWRLEWGMALLVFLTPFSENESISQPTAAPLRLSLILLAAVLVAVELPRLIRRGGQIELPQMSRAATLFLAVGLFSVLVAEDYKTAASKLLLLIGSVAVFAIIAISLREWERLQVVLGAAVCAGLVVGLHAIFQQLTGQLSDVGFLTPGGDVEYRVTSFFSHPNQLAGFEAVLIPVAAVLVRHATWRWLRVASVALVVVAFITVLITFSRGALVGLLALPLMALRVPKLWPLVAVAVALVVLLAPGAWKDRVIGARTSSPEIATRLDAWRAARQAFTERPVLGWGLNNFPNAYVTIESPGRDFLGTGELDIPPTAHDLYLNVAAEQGLAGLTALLILAVAFTRLIRRLRAAADPRTRAMGLGLLGMALVLALHNVFDVTFTDPKTSTLVWTLTGVGAALAARASQAESTD
jgi:O-antigen ligase